MKKLLVIALALMLPICTFAQKKGFKLVEKSGQKPEWVGKGSVKGFIIVQSDKATLEEAKSDAMQKVRAEIAESVATNVQRTVDSYTQRVTEDGNSITNSTIKMESSTRIAKMPAIQGVSITKAETYNEIYRNKKTGETYCVLYVKYPFSQFDMVELVTAYEKYDSEINDKIKKYEDGLNSDMSVKEIDASVTALDGLAKELGDDDPRIERINTIINGYVNAKMKKYEDGLDNIKSVEEIDVTISALGIWFKELGDDPRASRITSITNRYIKVYDDINIEIVENNPKKLVVRLVYNGNTITTSQMPRVTSNCADQFNTKNEGDKIVVNYSSEYCYGQDDNYIELRFKFGSKFVKKQAFIKLK